MSDLLGDNRNAANNEPLSRESLEEAIQAIFDEPRQIPIGEQFSGMLETLSPYEYLRRLGYKLPIPQGWLHRLIEEHRK